VNFPATLFALYLVAIPAAVSGTAVTVEAVSGTEVDIYDARNPFEFVKKQTVKKVRRIPKEKKVETKVDLIMLKGSEKLAVIGEKSFRVGDMFEGYSIISITLDYVELSSKNGNKRLYLK